MHEGVSLNGPATWFCYSMWQD